MALEDTYNIDSLKNKNEEAVLNMLEEMILEDPKMFCICPICVLDVAALALNMLPPRYHVSPFAGQRFQNEADRAKYYENVRKAIFEAVKRVKKYPHHK